MKRILGIVRLAAKIFAVRGRFSTNARVAPILLFPSAAGQAGSTARLGLRLGRTGILVALVIAALGGMGCAPNEQFLAPLSMPDSPTLDVKVGRLLKADPELRSYDIRVNTFRGEVQLDGVVDSEPQRERATQLAFAVPGVRGVANNLILRSAR